jgi:hypothetical protein
MTQAEFNQLPLLLKPSQVMQALGVNWAELQLLPLKRYTLPPTPGRRRRYSRYYRIEVARLARLEA